MQNVTAGLTLELFTQKQALKIESSTLRQYSTSRWVSSSLVKVSLCQLYLRRILILLQILRWRCTYTLQSQGITAINSSSDPGPLSPTVALDTLYHVMQTTYQPREMTETWLMQTAATLLLSSHGWGRSNCYFKMKMLPCSNGILDRKCLFSLPCLKFEISCTSWWHLLFTLSPPFVL